jgi:hypothetical protein
MSANVDAMVREGINAYRAGNKEEARTLLLKAVEINEQNEQAWLWLSAVVDTPEDQQTCLENVLMINPNNERAQQGLRILKQKTAGTSPSTSQQADEDAFANVSFTQPAPAPAPSVEEDELPSSVQWDMPATETSSASAYRRVDEPTGADYDDWVAGLNLNNSAPAAPPVFDNSPAFTSSPFVMDDMDEDAFGFDEDPSIPETTRTASDFTSGPFASFDDVPAFDEDDEDDLPRASASVRSPAPSGRVMSPPKEDDEEDFLSDIVSDSLLDSYDDGDLGALDPSEFFSHIPPEIQPTRVPGTKEREPVLALLLFILLLLANVGAVGLLVMRLIA